MISWCCEHTGIFQIDLFNKYFHFSLCAKIFTPSFLALNISVFSLDLSLTWVLYSELDWRRFFGLRVWLLFSFFNPRKQKSIVLSEVGFYSVTLIPMFNLSHLIFTTNSFFLSFLQVGQGKQILGVLSTSPEYDCKNWLHER